MSKKQKNKTITFRITENSLNNLKARSEKYEMSINGYISFLINSSAKKQKISFKEELSKVEKKEVKSGLYLTKSEVELLKRYAQNNDWSLHKELRYRVISSLSKIPKLNDEELKAMYSMRFSINVLGANLNRLVQNSQGLSEDNINICSELLSLIVQVKDKINYLEKCTYSNFKLKEAKPEKIGTT